MCTKKKRAEITRVAGKIMINAGLCSTKGAIKRKRRAQEEDSEQWTAKLFGDPFLRCGAKINNKKKKNYS